MNATRTQQTKAELLQFIRDVFPDSRSVPDAELKQQIDKAWQKGLHYGLQGPDHVGSYVIAAYVLGENFDQDLPEAAALLHDAAFTSAEKVDRLEALAKDSVLAMASGEGNYADERMDDQVQAMLAEEAARQEGGNAGNTADPYREHYEVQRVSQPYRLVAEWAVDKLRRGDLEAILKKFSPGVIAKVGRPRVEAILREKVIPFFQASMDIADPVEVGKTKLENGAEGYAFFMHLFALRRTKPLIGTKPFLIVVVPENGQLLIASVDVDPEN
jgi:hypothetical protein